MRRSLLAAVVFLALAPSARAAVAGDVDVGDVAVVEVAVVEAVREATVAFQEAARLEPSQQAVAFRRSAELHEGALAVAPPHGGLEFNTANAWLLAGDTARAIVHYRRAERLRPGDQRILTNLEVARAQRVDEIDEASGRAIVATLAFWHSGLSLRAKVPITLSTWALGCGLLAVMLLVERRRRALRIVGVALVIVALAVGVSTIVELDEREARDVAVVLAEQVELRTGDGDAYPPRYERPVHAGTEVRVLGERAGWREIELPDGKSGWVPADAVERV